MRYDKIENYFIQTGENAKAASNSYHDRYPQERQPSRDIFAKLRHNLINDRQFEKKKPKHLRNLIYQQTYHELTLGDFEKLQIEAIQDLRSSSTQTRRF